MACETNILCRPLLHYATWLHRWLESPWSLTGPQTAEEKQRAGTFECFALRDGVSTVAMIPDVFPLDRLVSMLVSSQVRRASQLLSKLLWRKASAGKKALIGYQR